MIAKQPQQDKSVMTITSSAVIAPAREATTTFSVTCTGVSP